MRQLLLVLVLPIILASMGNWVIALLYHRFHPTPKETGEALQRFTFFTALRVPAFIISIALYVVIGLGAQRAWAWYSKPIALNNSEMLVTISVVAMTAWSGCLIAYTMKKRLSPRLSTGLRYLVYAIIAPLITLSGSAFIVRTLALYPITIWAYFAVGQFIRRRTRWTITSRVDINVPDDAPPEVRALANELSRENSEYYYDRAVEYMSGWPLSTLLCSLSILVFAFASEKVVAMAALVSFFVGLNRAFKALVAPQLASVNLSATPRQPEE